MLAYAGLTVEILHQLPFVINHVYPEGVPPLSPGLTPQRRLPWVNWGRKFQPQRGCVNPKGNAHPTRFHVSSTAPALHPENSFFDDGPPGSLYIVSLQRDLTG